MPETDILHCGDHTRLMETMERVESHTCKIPAMDKKIDIHIAEHEAKAKMLKLVALVIGIGGGLLGLYAGITKIVGV